MDDVLPPDAMSVPAAPVVLIGAAAPPGPRQFTDRHAALLGDPELRDSPHWSATALLACLEHLRVSSVTEAARVAVVDAWLDGPDAFCVVYRPPFDGERVVGLRRCRQEAVDTQEWRLGDMTTWGYDMSPRADWVDPVAFGWNVADFDIGEPLGFVATILRNDCGDIGWWGSLGVALPRRPRVAE